MPETYEPPGCAAQAQAWAIYRALRRSGKSPWDALDATEACNSKRYVNRVYLITNVPFTFKPTL